MAKYSTNLNDTTAQFDNQGPTNKKPEFDIDEIAACFGGRIQEEQEQEFPRTATSIDFSRQRELRRYLVRNKL